MSVFIVDVIKEHLALLNYAAAAALELLITIIKIVLTFGIKTSTRKILIDIAHHKSTKLSAVISYA